MPVSSSDLIHIAYYITGHGYGHATRSIELIRGLLVTRRYRVTIVSSLPANFFLSELLPQIPIKELLQAREVLLDTGGIQVDAIHMDPIRTLRSYYDRIHCSRDILIRQEVDWMRGESVGLALIDATPIASAAASICGIHSIFVTNITWDYVYSTNLESVENSPDLLQDLTSYHSIGEIRDMVTQCTNDVSLGSAFIQHQGQCPLPSQVSLSKIFTAPLICRSLHNPTNNLSSDAYSEFNIRGQYGLSSDTRLLLLGFGGHDTKWNGLQDSYLPEGWHCFVLRATEADIPSSRFHALPIDTYVPAFISQVDVVIGKMGYGTVSECLTAGRVLCYIPRVHWPEEDALASLLNQYNAGIKLPLDAFLEGNWADVLEEALRRKNSWQLDKSQWLVPNDATESMVALLEQVISNLPEHGSA